MRYNHVRGVRHIIKAFGFSMAGLRAAWRCEAAFRMEVIGVALLIPLGIVLGATPAERALLVGALMLVLVTELLNSGIEAIVDRVGEEPHRLSARAKDVGSAAVFVSLCNALLVWVLILWPDR